MNAKTLVRCGGFGFALAVSAMPAQSPEREPAARLVRAVPVLEPTASIVVRALAPTPETVATSATASNWIHGPMPTTVRPLPSAQPTSVSPQSRPAVVPAGSDSTWQSLKNFLVGPTQPAMPTARPELSRETPTATAQPAMTMMRAPAAPTMHPGVYAGPPAYRWYGWGTTTPGRNPLAPAGQSPRGSAGWYAQTGATPGAFPVTAQAASSAYAVADAPQYRPIGAQPRFAFGPTESAFPTESFPSAMPPLPPGAVIIADGIAVPYAVPYSGPFPLNERQPVVLGTNGASMPMFPVPPSYAALPVPAFPFSIPVPPTAVVAPAATAFAAPLPVPVAPPAPSLNWSSAVGTTIPFGAATTAPGGANWGTPPSVVRPQAPADPTAATLDSQIRKAVQGLAVVVEIKHVGLSKLLVRMQTTSAVEARTAAAAVSAIPALKPYAVEFEVVAATTAK